MNWIIKPGFFERKRVGKSQPGLDLSRAIGDFLVKHGLATTEDCCTYTSTGGGGTPQVTEMTGGEALFVATGVPTGVYLNGQRLTPGASYDYTVTGNTINFTTAITVDNPIQAGDILLVDF